MSRRADPVLIGGFVLGALALAVATLLLLAGGELFSERRRQIMVFEGAAQGLQIGAPVMFLGVKIGTVKKIQLGLDEASGRFVVPVTVEIQPNVVHTANGEQIDLRDAPTQRRLIERGLRARLRMQSLLTGQLYVDLDFHPDKPPRFRSSDPAVPEIPTIPTTVQELTGKIENFPVDAFLGDLAAIGDSLRGLTTDPETRGLPRRMQEVLGRIETLAARLDAQLTPALAEARRDLAELRSTLAAAGSALARVEAAADQVGSAANRVGALAAPDAKVAQLTPALAEARRDLAELRSTLAAAGSALARVEAAADQVGSAANRVGALAAPDAKVAQGMGRAADELAGAARSLRSLTAEDAPTVQNLNEALKELARAARALRVLAETLDRHPEALIRGKKAAEGTP